MTTDSFGAFEGDLSAEAAFDELLTIIENIARRNDELTGLKGFCSVDVPSVRANAVLLTSLITTYGGGAAQVTENRFNTWAEAIRKTFEDEARWGFVPWPEAEKKAWLDACNADLILLHKAVADTWE